MCSHVISSTRMSGGGGFLETLRTRVALVSSINSIKDPDPSGNNLQKSTSNGKKPPAVGKGGGEEEPGQR